MDYFDSPSITIRWNEKDRNVEQEWKGYASSKDYRTSADKTIALLVEKGAADLLTDTRRMEVILPDDQVWTETDWVPRAMAAGLRRMAVVMPEKAVAQLSVSRLSDRVDFETIGLERVFFDSVEKARVWLRT